MQQLRRQVQRIAPYFRRALLIGEPGTGKELIARQLHTLSPVASGPFICCTAICLAEDNTALESARRGTLFLHDLGSLSLQLQDGLVRRLTELDRRVRTHVAETRLIAASNTDLKTLAATGRFRQDLYGCLSVVELRVPPLRERLEDLDDLAQVCLAHSVLLAPAASTRLRQHTWPGNLGELRTALEEAAANAAAIGSISITEKHLPPLIASPDAPATATETPTIARLEDVMRRHVVDVLARCAGNKLRAAELLGISRSTLYRMLDGA